MMTTEDSGGHFKGVLNPVFGRVAAFLLAQTTKEQADLVATGCWFDKSPL